MGETNLPTAAQVLREAYVLASRSEIGEYGVARANILLTIARELREGSVKLPIDTRLLLTEIEDLRAGNKRLRHDLEAAEVESAMWHRRAIAAEALGVAQESDAPVSAPLFDVAAAVTQTQIPAPALRPHEGTCPACGAAVYAAETAGGKEFRHRTTGTTECPNYGREP